MYIYIYMGPLQLAIYDSWWQAIELTKKKKQPPTWLSFGGPTLYYVYIYIYMAMGQNPGTK